MCPPRTGSRSCVCVQEAITNAMRYSRDGSFIRVVTEYSPAGVRIVVENDGAQPEAESAGAGWGLRGLQERVATLGGTVVAGPAAPGVLAPHRRAAA